MKQILQTLALSAFFTLAAQGAHAQAKVFNAEDVVFCSDGEFDWESGQSLYDFVILSRPDGRFLISYLGIPHPSFEQREFNNAWMKVKGQFSAKRLSGTARAMQSSTYQMVLDIIGSDRHVATLKIDKTGKYSFAVAPPLPLDYVTSSGLCWDSLDDEPEAIRKKSKRSRNTR